MNPLGTRARVEELARLLDGAVAGPSSLTAGHATLATRLRAVAPSLDLLAVPRAEFRATLRTRLVAVATVQAAAAAPYAEPLARPTARDAAMAWTQSREAQRRIGVTAGAMAGVIAFTGVGIAASRSLPGQPFYGLKRGTEDVQLQLTSGDTAKGTKHLEFASTRLREVNALAHGDAELAFGTGTTAMAAGGLSSAVTRKINETLADFNAETRTGRLLLEKAYHATGKPEPLRILKTFSSQQEIRLASIIPALPTASQKSAQQSLKLVADVGSTATQLLAIGTCGGQCSPQGAGPTLPSGPVPAPGSTATPGSSPSSSPSGSSASPDNNGVPPCTCVAPTSAPRPTTEPSPTATPTPTATPSAAPSASPTASPTPSSTPSPTSKPTASPGIVPPLPLPTILPTIIPTLPPVPGIPVPPVLSALIPTLLPLPRH
jgi:hypothetical protein